jgi:hypothetical protein
VGWVLCEDGGLQACRGRKAGTEAELIFRMKTSVPFPCEPLYFPVLNGLPELSECLWEIGLHGLARATETTSLPRTHRSFHCGT